MKSINDLDNMANKILVDNDMFRLPVDLVKIANNNNIDVYKLPLPDNISGAIKYNSNALKFQILIDSRESAMRQRFTLAHELAHYFLEGDRMLQTQDIHYDIMYRKINDKTEREVDYLAGALLMDKMMVEELYKINPSIELLAETFKVSQSAMAVRLIKLGLVQ